MQSYIPNYLGSRPCIPSAGIDLLRQQKYYYGPTGQSNLNANVNTNTNNNANALGGYGGYAVPNVVQPLVYPGAAPIIQSPLVPSVLPSPVLSPYDTSANGNSNVNLNNNVNNNANSALPGYGGIPVGPAPIVANPMFSSDVLLPGPSYDYNANANANYNANDNVNANVFRRNLHGSSNE